MSFLQNIKLLKKLHVYIKRKSTGNPKQFARRLGISESKLYRVLLELKDENVTIKYDSFLQTYFYENEFDIMALFNLQDGKS